MAYNDIYNPYGQAAPMYSAYTQYRPTQMAQPPAVQPQPNAVPTPAPQMPVGGRIYDRIWVMDIAEANAYPVANGSSVELWDRNRKTIYVKSRDVNGMPDMVILDYIERTSDPQPVMDVPQQTVTREEFDKLSGRFKELEDKISRFAAPVKRRAKAETEEYDE